MSPAKNSATALTVAFLINFSLTAVMAAFSFAGKQSAVSPAPLRISLISLRKQSGLKKKMEKTVLKKIDTQPKSFPVPKRMENPLKQPVEQVIRTEKKAVEEMVAEIPPDISPEPRNEPAAEPASAVSDKPASTIGNASPEVKIARRPGFIRRIKPAYPESERLTGREGTVLLEAAITADGRVGAIKIIKADSKSFAEAAVKAARESLFSPAYADDGKPVPARVLIPFSFRLD
jgi:TonB family protein